MLLFSFMAYRSPLEIRVGLVANPDTPPFSNRHHPVSCIALGTVWGALGLDFYLLEVFRERLESPDLRRAIIRLHHQHQAAATLIEQTELGRALAQDLY